MRSDVKRIEPNGASKKNIKESNIYESALNLFYTKGITNTSIDDIVKNAGVAKGTFYLYFKSKLDIVERVVLKQSFSLFNDAVNATLSKEFENSNDTLIFLVNYIIEHFKENKTLLKIIYKNFSWKIFKNTIEYEEMKNLLQQLKEIMTINRTDEENFEKNLFMIVELTGAVCYYSIIFKEPEPIDEMKPILLKMISKMIY